MNKETFKSNESKNFINLNNFNKLADRRKQEFSNKKLKEK